MQYKEFISSESDRVDDTRGSRFCNQKSDYSYDLLRESSDPLAFYFIVPHDRVEERKNKPFPC